MKAFIIFRDRVTYARQCFSALQTAGLDVHVVDHASSWPAALAWLQELQEQGIPVLLRNENAYPWELWTWRPFQEAVWGAGPYLVTDPDVVPSEGCPPGWPQRLEQEAMRRGNVKAGLGLRLDGLPEARQDVIDGERPFWGKEIRPGVYEAKIDTTLAVYRPWDEHPFFSLCPAVRTGPPYVAEHLAWHEAELSPELTYYYAHENSHRTVAR